ncbi:MAG: Xaa-Pro peptidase family protein [Acidobacteriota bacterium]
MSGATGPDWPARLAAIQSQLPGRGVDAFVISTPHNIFYLCGFNGSAGLLVITGTSALLITDGRYAFSVRQKVADGGMAPVQLEQVDRRYDLTLGEVAGRLDLQRVGFEPSHVTVATLRSWERAAAAVTWVPADDLVERARLIKDAYEIALFRRGGALIGQVIELLPTLVRAGRGERAVAADIEKAIMDVGFDAPAFETIVASGPNSALPHARPTNRSIGPGDLVVLDFGGVLDGYCVDVTRMSAVGPLTDRAMALFEAVKVATEAAIAAVRPGIPTSDVDRAARDILTSRGLGEAFMHSTGHGLGLDVHEAPRVGRSDPEAHELMQPGMVFTIEPGAYIEGLGGVRLEDDVLVTTAGSEVLTPASRDLLFV